MASFSDLFKLGKEILKAETFVLHEAETRGADEGVCVRARHIHIIRNRFSFSLSFAPLLSGIIVTAAELLLETGDWSTVFSRAADVGKCCLSF